MADRFELYMHRLLSHEGGYSNDRNDPGNWTGGRVGAGKLKGTKFGIAANTYPELDIAGLTWADAVKIYRRDFWQAIGADALPASVAYSALDGAINSGVQQSVRWLQRAAGVADDGRFGPATQAAIERTQPHDLVLRYNAERLEFMTRLRAWDNFGRGWARRIAANLAFAAEDF